MFMGNFWKNLIFIIFLSFIFDFNVQKDAPNKAFETGVSYLQISQNIICPEKMYSHFPGSQWATKEILKGLAGSSLFLESMHWPITAIWCHLSFAVELTFYNTGLSGWQWLESDIHTLQLSQGSWTVKGAKIQDQSCQALIVSQSRTPTWSLMECRNHEDPFMI